MRSLNISMIFCIMKFSVKHEITRNIATNNLKQQSSTSTRISNDDSSACGNNNDPKTCHNDKAIKKIDKISVLLYIIIPITFIKFRIYTGGWVNGYITLPILLAYVNVNCGAHRAVRSAYVQREH